MQSIDITVKYSAGAYATNTIGGKRASSTTSAQRAAESLGDKVFGTSFARAEHLHDISVGCERWRLLATTEEA